MLGSDLQTQIRHWFYAEHWKVGTIAQELGLHPNTVRHALDTEQFNRAKALPPLVTDPYVEFIRQTLQNYPRLRATRIYQMIRERGYTGSVVQLRRVVARLRPVRQEPFLQVKVHQECTKTSTVKIPAKPESTCAPAHSFSYHQV